MSQLRTSPAVKPPSSPVCTLLAPWVSAPSQWYEERQDSASPHPASKSSAVRQTHAFLRAASLLRFGSSFAPRRRQEALCSLTAGEGTSQACLQMCSRCGAPKGSGRVVWWAAGSTEPKGSPVLGSRLDATLGEGKRKGRAVTWSKKAKVHPSQVGMPQSSCKSVCVGGGGGLLATLQQPHSKLK